MAWEISMSMEGWGDVRCNLHAMDKQELIDAIADDELEAMETMPGDSDEICAARKAELDQLDQDTLADAAYDLIAEHNTCDNGGHAVWIDRQGFHTVSVSLTAGGAEILKATD